jgi:hypothetical protein
MKLKYSIKRKFETFIRQVYHEPNTGCWLWSGAVNNSGYPNFSFDKITMGHRFSYLFHKGDFDRSLLVCHHCDVKICVNPDHLFLGTYNDNNKDRTRKGRTVAHHGEKQGSAKLKEEEVVDIKRFINAGIQKTWIAKLYGVHKSTIDYIFRGKNWGYLNKK